MSLRWLLNTVRGLDGKERFLWGGSLLAFAVAAYFIAITPESWPMWRNLGIIAVVIAVITITLLRLLDEGFLRAAYVVSSCLRVVTRRIRP
jgi:predicted branched-subunit amino acid permease